MVLKTQYYLPIISVYHRYKQLGIWVIMLLAYVFIAYKFATFTEYHHLAQQWQSIPFTQFWYLFFVLALLPINLFLEAYKWKLLTANFEILSFSKSFRAVLAGIYTGFFTPNRVGEMVGRWAYLTPQNRKYGVTMTVVSGVTQNIIMLLCGLPAGILFFFCTNLELSHSPYSYFAILLLLLCSLILLYFALPHLGKKWKEKSFNNSVSSYISCLSNFSSTDLLGILSVSLFRYTVFCIQFFFLLHFFGVHLELWQALLAIPANYLLVTFTPSVALSEAAIRSSYAVIFVGAYSHNVVGIALAGFFIWVINFTFPLLAGSVLYFNYNSKMVAKKMAS